jgi:hypothetical protein
MNPLNTAREVAKLVQDYNNLPLKKMIVQLEDEITALQSENREMKQQLAIRAEMTPKGPHNYFYCGDVGPYCPKCWQADGKAALLPALEDFAAGLGRRCQVCKELYVEQKATRRRQVIPRSG